LPTLFSIGFVGSLMNTTATQAFTSMSGTATVNCSPLTEVFNPNIGGGTDFLFVGLSASCGLGGASSAQGCVGAFNINTVPTSATVGVSAQSESGGSSGIVVDNVSNTCINAPNPSCNTGAAGASGASSIYFSTIGNAGASPIQCTTDGATTGGGCAVKLTQSGLQ